MRTREVIRNLLAKFTRKHRIQVGVVGFRQLRLWQLRHDSEKKYYERKLKQLMMNLKLKSLD